MKTILQLFLEKELTKQEALDALCCGLFLKENDYSQEQAESEFLIIKQTKQI